MLEEEQSRFEDDISSISSRSDAHYYFMLGEMAMNKSNMEEAFEFFQRASEYETRPAPMLRKRLAQLYLHEGKVKDARRELEAGLDDAGDDVEYLQVYAGVLSNQKEYDRAIELYRKAIKIDPKNNEYTTVLIANVYEQKGDLQGAARELNRLIRTSPGSVFGHYYRARVAEALKDSKGAEKYYKKAMILGKSSEVIAFDYARYLTNEKRFDDALKISEGILKSSPGNVKARRLSGSILLKQNRVNEALHEFEELTKFEQDASSTRIRIAVIKIDQGDYEGAVTELNLILADKEDNSTARYYLGTALAGLKHNSEAVEELLKVDSDEQYFAESRVLAAYLLRQTGDVKGAVSVIEDVIENDSKNTKQLAFLASLQKESGNIEDAIETIERMIEIEPKKDINYFTAGVFHDEAGDKEKAIEFMEKAVELNPKNADALNYLGYTLAVEGVRLDEAEAFLKRALSFDPNNGYYLDSLGWILYKKGKNVEALKLIKRAVELAPRDAVILEHKAILQQELGQYAEALETLEKAEQFVSESDDKEVGGRIAEALEEIKEKIPSSAPLMKQK